MTTYGIAREDGAVLADGIADKRVALNAAQLAADSSGERVWLYLEGVFAAAEAVEPQRFEPVPAKPTYIEEF